MSLSHDSLDLPRAFGPYLLLRRLAVGGMAEVYVARARGISGFEKLVAIKVIHPRYSEDEHFITLLVEEAKISVLLTHVNVGQIFDLGVVHGTYYIALEYIEGADAYRMQRKASDVGLSLPLDVCMFIVAEVCHGLDYAHRKRDADGKPLGIVHRDISPQNVLISFAGDVKIVDFGIAKAALRSGQTEAGVIKGKYYYMSPEQAWGDPMDHRSDIFSAGIVLYELLIGEMLYREDNIPMVLDRVRKAEIPPPSTRRKDVSPELSAIVMRALAKKPEDRFQSAHEMAQALMQLLYDTSPSFTSARVAQLMAQLFPEEILRNAELAALAADDPDTTEAVKPPPRRDAPKPDAPKLVAARLPRPPPSAVRPSPATSPLDSVPTKAPPARALAFNLGDDEEEDDRTRNDLLPFRRALAMRDAAAARQASAEEPAPQSARAQDATASVRARAQRADATQPARGSDRGADWEEDATAVLAGARPSREDVPRASVEQLAPAPTPAGASIEELDSAWNDEATSIDDGLGANSLPALFRERAAAAAKAADAAAAAVKDVEAAAPRSAEQPAASRPRPMPSSKPRSMPPPSKGRSIPPPSKPRSMPPPRRPHSMPPPHPARSVPPPARRAPAAMPRAAPQSDALPPPYPKAYVPAPAAPPYPKPYVSAPAPSPALIASSSPPSRSSSPTDALDAEPPTMPAAPSWSSEARPAAAGQGGPLPGASPSLDPRTGPAYDPFAPQPAPGAPTAAYAAVSAGGRARPGRPLVWLLGAAVVVVLAAFGLSAFFASHRPLTPTRVVSVPAEAHVRVDGVELPGLTPLVLPAPLDPTRSHEIEVTRAGFRPYVIVVRVGDTQPQQIAILTPE